MTTKSRRLWFELVSREALISFMDHRDESVRTLAAKCLVRDPVTGRTKSLPAATIGHLRSGGRVQASPATVKAIETALGVPPGLLFVPRVLASYQREQRNILAQQDQAA